MPPRQAATRTRRNPLPQPRVTRSRSGAGKTSDDTSTVLPSPSSSASTGSRSHAADVNSSSLLSSDIIKTETLPPPTSRSSLSRASSAVPHAVIPAMPSAEPRLSLASSRPHRRRRPGLPSLPPKRGRRTPAHAAALDALAAATDAPGNPVLAARAWDAFDAWIDDEKVRNSAPKVVKREREEEAGTTPVPAKRAKRTFSAPHAATQKVAPKVKAMREREEEAGTAPIPAKRAKRTSSTRKATTPVSNASPATPGTPEGTTPDAATPDTALVTLVHRVARLEAQVAALEARYGQE